MILKLSQNFLKFNRKNKIQQSSIETQNSVIWRKRKLIEEHEALFNWSLAEVFKKMSPKSKPFSFILNWRVYVTIDKKLLLEPSIKNSKRFKAEYQDETRYVDLKKARQEKENAQQTSISYSGFMSDCIIKKSLIEREKEIANKQRQLALEKEKSN